MYDYVFGDLWSCYKSIIRVCLVWMFGVGVFVGIRFIGIERRDLGLLFGKNGGILWYVKLKWLFMVLIKLLIIVYLSSNYVKSVCKGKFEVLINFEMYKWDVDIDYDKIWVIGLLGGDLCFKKMKLEKIFFFLIFDGIGFVSIVL